MAVDPLTGDPWTLMEVNAWTTKFGVLRTNPSGGTPRITQLYVTVNYTPPISGTLDMNLSWNNGVGWTSAKTVTMTSTETATTLGNATDAWGRTWTASDFADGNFILRVTNNFSNGITASLNYSTVKVYYSIPSTGLYQTVNTIVSTINSSGGTDLSAAVTVGNDELNGVRHQVGFRKVLILVSDGKPNRPLGPVDKEGLALDAADLAKQGGSELFTVHFGTNSGRDLVAQLANGTTPNSPHEPGSYNDAGTSNDQADIDAENTDDDNFFIAPTSSDMPAIFDLVGKKACPAAIPPPPPSPPLPPPPPPSPASPITVGSWDEIISTSP